MANKLLLTQDVEDLGRSGDIVSVKPGYARNYLIPHGFAVIADKRALKMQARLQEERRKKAAQDKEESEKLSTTIEGITITTVVKVDHEGHMYGSVTAQEIVHLLQEQANLNVEKRSLQVKHPFKEIGVHKVNIKLKEGVTSTITLKIVSEADRENAAPAAE